MTVQLNVVSLGKSLKHLSGEVAVALVYLMKIINAMGCPGLDPDLLGLGVPRLGGCRSLDSTHDTGGQPAQQGAGIHGGRSTLIFELLRHRVCPRLLCRDRFRDQAGNDVATGRSSEALMLSEPMPHLK